MIDVSCTIHWASKNKKETYFSNFVVKLIFRIIKNTITVNLASHKIENRHYRV